MSLKRKRPTSPGVRHKVVVQRTFLFKGRPEKSLCVGLSSTGGRNNNGRKNSRKNQGRHKRLYRFVDFRYHHEGQSAEVERLEYDPNRTAYIMLVRFEDGHLAYLLAPNGVSVGDKIFSGDDVDIKPGNSLPLSSMPLGTLVHNVELKPGKGGQFARAAGSFARVVSRDQGYVVLLLSSGEQRRVLSVCRATVGVLSNSAHANRKLGKAGAKRHRGIRPRVRAVAMNPHDHPLGGGEGKTSGGRPPCSRSGFPAKGGRTRRKRKSSRLIEVSRHSSKKRRKR